MDCEQVRDLLSDDLEGSLSDAQRAAVAAHLRECLPCQSAKDGLRETLLLLRNLPSEKAPPELIERIRSRIAQEEAPPAPLWKKLFLPARIKVPLEAAAAVLLFLLVYGAQKGDFPKLFPAPPAARTAVAPLPEAGAREAERNAGISGESVAPVAPAEKNSPKAPVSRPATRASAKGNGDSRTGRSARESATAPATAPRAQASLPVVPAQRVSTGGGSVEPPPAVVEPPRITWPASFGGEVTIEVPAQHRAGLEERIAVAVTRLGGIVPGKHDPADPSGEIAADTLRVHLRTDAAIPFLAELSKLGTLPAEEMSGWAEPHMGTAAEIAAYRVRIRVR